MTPAVPKRPAFRLPLGAALLALALGLVSPSTFGSEVVPSGVLPLGLDRLFARPTLELDAVVTEPAALASEPRPIPDRYRFRRQVTDRYLARLPFGPQMTTVARSHRVDGLLLAAVVEAESSFRRDAVSEKGALGLMQLMPPHFEEGSDPFDPAVNLDHGARLLAGLERQFDGDLTLALAAYHAGPGAVARWGGVPPYRDTRRYVERVLAIYQEHHENLDRTLAGAAIDGVAARTL